MKFVINTQHYCGRDANFFFEIKQEKNKLGKECETGSFQSKVTNYVRAEMRMNTKYQTSRGRNSYSSFVLVLGSKALQQQPMMLYSEVSVNSVLKLIGVSFQLRQGVIYDENQKSVTKSFRDRISQVMLNHRNIKRELSGEERKEKEKMESDEQAIKSNWDENDKEASPLTSEAAKEKEEKENKERITDLDSSADAPLTSHNSLEGKSVIDHAMSRLEGIEEFSHSPHGTIDVLLV